jgi:hypothetical protein
MVGGLGHSNLYFETLHHVLPRRLRNGKYESSTSQQQIGTLTALQKRLNEFRRACTTSAASACFRTGELCCLIEDLPNPKNGGRNAKTVRARDRAAGNSGG